MKAMVLTRFGGSEVFEEREVPQPEPQAHELLVKVYATSVNPMDVLFRQGAGQWAGITPSTILGYDVSGEVAAVGEGVHDFQVGDAVYYTPDPYAGQGSNAEYHVVHEAIVARKPVTLTHLEAASIPLVSIVGPTGDLNAGYYKYLTVHFSCCQRTRSTLDELRILLEQGQIKPVIETVLPLCEIAQAHERLAQGGLHGKIVLQVEESESGR